MTTDERPLSTLNIYKINHGVAHSVHLDYRYYLYNTIYWLPADPWDTQPEQWRPDLSKFAWVCRPKGRQYSPDDDAGMTQYVADFRMVQSARQCQMVIDHWIIQKDEAPAARKRIDTSSEDWLVAA